MSSRIALPLRLVQCDWGTATASSASTATRTPVLTPYKPSGLPCYAASQVSAVSGTSAAAKGAGGRRLFAVHTRHEAPATSSSSFGFEAGPQPRPEDPSDSLLTRVVDAALPGCRPYVALPVVSSLLRRGGRHHDDDGVSAAMLNQWTCRHKGLVVVTQTPSDALFLRNAAQLDLVQQTFRVVCRLPAGVADAVRRYLSARQSQSGATGGTQGGGAGQARVAAAAALNPYLRAHAERQRSAQNATDLTLGIPLIHPTGAHSLPAGVRAHPLVTGGFFDVGRGLLRVQGTTSCFLRAQTPLHPASAERVQQYSRLQRLFTAPPSPNSSVAENKDGMVDVTRHPWMKPGWRLGVSLDAARMQAAAATTAASSLGDATESYATTSLSAPRGKRLLFDFRLLALSAHDGSDAALYEVHTRGDVTADEIAAVFHAEGLSVLNDYVQDTGLADVVEEVAQRMRAAPPSALSALPMAVQHHLRTASAEELVALPLTLVPLEDADRLCIHQLWSDATNSGAASLSSDVSYASPPRVHLSEDAAQLHNFAQSLSGAAGARHPLHRLLWHALGSLRLSHPEERQAYERVVGLALGSGVECVGLAFPDPSVPATVHAMQQVWLSYEQHRQRRATSPAEAARAARQHPLAAELRFLRRSSLSDATGVMRVPLLEDLVDGARRQHGSRGECSFSHGVALSSPPAREDATLLPSRVEWEQMDVPPSYAEAFRGWAAGVAASTSLWPTPSEWRRRSAAGATAAAQPENKEGERGDVDMSNSSVTAARGATKSAGPSVRAILRVEETSELLCAHCGASGHTWQHCAARVRDAIAALEDTAAATASATTAHTRSARVDGAHRTVAALPSPSSVMEEEGLASVDDVAAALGDQATAATNARVHRADALAGYADNASLSSSSSSSLIAVPNMAATRHFKAEYALRNEARKPAVHRRTVRCVYCGGHHHVTACPKIQAQNNEEAEAHQTASELPLFCIKCGATGHLYRDCEQIPADLHPATHCPICQQRRSSHSHDPLHCPQRVQVPDGYTLSGMPATHAGGRTADGRETRGGGGFARRGRRRGSVLIADSFVDSGAR